MDVKHPLFLLVILPHALAAVAAATFKFYSPANRSVLRAHDSSTIESPVNRTEQVTVSLDFFLFLSLLHG